MIGDIYELLRQALHNYRQSNHLHDDETCAILKVEAGN